MDFLSNIFSHFHFKSESRVQLVNLAQKRKITFHGHEFETQQLILRECLVNLNFLTTYRPSVPRPSVVHPFYHSTLEKIQNKTKSYQHVFNRDF